MLRNFTDVYSRGKNGRERPRPWNGRCWMREGTGASAKRDEDAWRNGPARLPSLTGLRWIAAFAVFGFHVLHTPRLAGDGAGRTVLEVLFGAGATGVPFFFVLSGLVLTWSARPGDRAAAFWRRRAARVVPSHVLVWIGVLAVLVVTARPERPGPVLAGLVLMQSWVPDPAYYFAVNTPAWSLSCEIAFYAAFPLLLRALRRVPAHRLWTVAAAAYALIWLVPLASLPMPLDLGYWFVWILPVTRALEFLLGMTLALMIRSGRWHGPGLLASSALALGAYLTQPLVWDRWGWVAWMSGPLALLVAAAATADLRGRRSPLRAVWLVALGEVSFAFYLVHQPVLRFGARVVPQAPVLAAVGMLLAATAAAWLLHRLAERPLERLLAGRRPLGRPPAQERSGPESSAQERAHRPDDPAQAGAQG
ncbi:acyltransferase [Microbispora sp. KK1-11]|nr:acyltransferase [Microbispora sp. KK1-11]